MNEAKRLYWKFDGQGQWDALSFANDKGSHFEYRIGVCDDGTFDVSETDSELMGGTKKIDCFPSLQSAKDWCEANETVMAFNIERSEEYDYDDGGTGPRRR